jgi:F-type H+-transporting ATPase subunit b
MATAATSAHTEQPSGGHAPFPPFQKDTFASQILWLVITFVALYFLMAKIALPRVGAIIDMRKTTIDGNLADAEQLKAQSDAAIAAYEKSLADARARAQALAAETHQRQVAEAEVVRKALEATLNARIVEAERVIATTRTVAMANVQAIAIETAAAIVERLIGVTPSSADVSAAVADTLKS